MVIGKPEASSTPNSVPSVKGRRRIGEYNSIQSPIDNEVHMKRFNSPTRVNQSSPTQSPSSRSRLLRQPDSRSKSVVSGSNSQRESESDSANHESESEDNPVHLSSSNSSASSQNCWRTIVALLAALIVVLLGIYFIPNDATEGTLQQEEQILRNKISRMEKHYAKQDSDFWRSIRVNIEEIKAYEKPSTIMFLYENSAKNTMKSILNVVSNTAVCFLTKCANEPVVIQGSFLNSRDVIEDHGKIISWYREPLSENGVLVVENLERVPGKAARAFHTFCDEYDPLVKKALIIFTVEVEELPQEQLPAKYVRKLLSEIWNDIKLDDKFDPLFTRISGTILLVRPEGF